MRGMKDDASMVKGGHEDEPKRPQTKDLPKGGGGGTDGIGIGGKTARHEGYSKPVKCSVLTFPNSPKSFFFSSSSLCFTTLNPILLTLLRIKTSTFWSCARKL